VPGRVAGRSSFHLLEVAFSFEDMAGLAKIPGRQFPSRSNCPRS